MLATTEARPGRGGDYDFNDVLMRRSTDGGKSFGPAVKLVDHTTYGDGPASNFVIIPDRDSGRVVAVFCHDYARVFTIHSDDGGASWSEPVEITGVFEQFKSDYPWRVCATGPGHGTQLRNSRMIIPVWLSDGSGKEFAGGKHRGHRPSIVSLIYSDDRGKTWKRGSVCRHGDVVDPVVNPSETIAVELRWPRNVQYPQRKQRAAAWSPSARTTPPTGRSRFDDALSRSAWPAEPAELAGGGQPSRILFANPDNLENTLVKPGGNLAHDRKRLTVKMSCDERGRGRSRRCWKRASAYSDLQPCPTARSCASMNAHGQEPHRYRVHHLAASTPMADRRRGLGKTKDLACFSLRRSQSVEQSLSLHSTLFRAHESPRHPSDCPSRLHRASHRRGARHDGTVWVNEGHQPGLGYSAICRGRSLRCNCLRQRAGATAACPWPPSIRRAAAGLRARAIVDWEEEACWSGSRQGSSGLND